jgi:YihY family inner membrane protein
VTGATLMGQLERGLNRIYGIEQDRPTLQKYGRATVLALTAGVFAAIAFGALAFGDAINDAIERDATRSVWVVARWPVAFLLVTAAVGLVFRVAPRRRQPARSWLAVGAAVAVVLWFAVTAGLGLLFGVSDSFGATYGGLAGMVALLLWALLSSMAVFYGAAVAAQLEAVRAHAHAPQDREKAEHSAPDVEAPPLLHTFDADEGSLLERR